MSSSTWDGFTYFTDDMEFIRAIKAGQAEPYGSGLQLNMIKRYVANYPSRTRTMIDVGAHIGTTMLPYSRIFNRVVGYEPFKKSYDFCVKNIQYNNLTNCTVENCAVSNKRTTGVSLAHGSANSGCMFFREDVQGNVYTKVLDDESTLTDVDFLKIDTEGAELLVLTGAVNIIKTYKPLIQAEMNGLSERHFQISGSTLISFLSDLGYSNIKDTDFFVHSDYMF